MSESFNDDLAIHLARDFNQRLGNILPVRKWDSVYAGIIWKLRRDPAFDAFQLESDLWFAEIDSEPGVYVFYTLDLTARVVVLTDVRLL